MLLPTKHLRLDESILGLGASLLELLNDGATVDCVFDAYSRTLAVGSGNVSVDPAKLLLALDWLFMLGVIEPTPGGGVRRCV